MQRSFHTLMQARVTAPVEGVRKRKLDKEFIVNCRVSIIIIQLVHHVKEKHIKVLLVHQYFQTASIFVA